MTLKKVEQFENKEEKLDFFKIKSHFFSPLIDQDSFNNFLTSIKQLIETIIPEDLFYKAKINPTDENIKNGFLHLCQSIPIISAPIADEIPTSFTFKVLCFGDHTQGIGRFISDMLCKWLIPGKQLQIYGNRSFKFTFEKYENKDFFLSEQFMVIESKEDLQTIKENLPNFITELRLNILSVYHARYLTSIENLSQAQTTTIIQENLSTLIGKEKNKNSPSYNNMQQILNSLTEEKKLFQIKENIANLLQKKPKDFDKNIFDSVHNVSLLFKGNFTAKRDPILVSRIIAFQHLFKKHLKTNKIKKERQILVKIVKANYTSKKPTIGIIIALNLFSDAERFEKFHLKASIKSCIDNIDFLKESYIVDKREDKSRSYYIEIEKKTDTSFSLKELKEMKNKLPSEIKSRIENVMSPIFMPRNEEEVLRNLVLLSKQLKYVKDLPQVIISYSKQTLKDIDFNVILVRILKDKTPPLKEFFSYSQTFLKFHIEETKIIGYLKKKYQKEANIFRVSLNKKPFFRKDFSLDLQKARQTVVRELGNIIGNFRDYNGGMILKQTQLLDRLKNSFLHLNPTKEFLLENFFYSVKPGYMQSILCPEILKKLFLMLSNTLKEIALSKKIKLKTSYHDKYFLIMIGGITPSFKETVLQKVKVPSFDLSYSFIKHEDSYAMGFIYRSSCSLKRKEFHQIIMQSLSLIENEPLKASSNLE